MAGANASELQAVCRGNGDQDCPALHTDDVGSWGFGIGSDVWVWDDGVCCGAVGSSVGNVRYVACGVGLGEAAVDDGGI